MFDNFYDKVEYKCKSDKLDKFGNIVYIDNKMIEARYVGGGSQYVVNSNTNETKLSHEYHTAEQVKEGDMLDNRLVISSEPSRDIFGKVCFYIVKVV